MNSQAFATIPEIVSKESWESEFRFKHAIPSSTRFEPAKALLLFSELLNLGHPLRVLDAGTGNGRNSVYLAKRGCDVTSVDFSDFALEETKRRAQEAGLASRVSVVRHSMDSPFPFGEETFDFVLDAYVFCHFLREEMGRRFWQDMSRVTKRNGRLLSIAFSREDEYYSRLLKDSPDGMLVLDPANGIWKRLYSEDALKEFFSSRFRLEYFTKFEFSDVVLGKPFRRVVFASVLQKNSE